MDYDAFLLVSFGGPESREDVIPFLENVLRGRNVPRERMLEVAEHYYHFGGGSPLNDQNRDLLDALKEEFAASGIDLPLYWGNRNWHPLLPDTLGQMEKDGVRRALAFFTSTFSSYSGCRQYQENIAAAQQTVGSGAPAIDKLRPFFNHPGFIEAMVDRTRVAYEQIPLPRRAAAHLLFTAHSIPLSMSQGCPYEEQLLESSRLVAAGIGHERWRLVYQSRSGPPSQPWLGPDIGDALAEIGDSGRSNDPVDVVVVPIGFISDHMEVLFDLDEEARSKAAELGINFHRASTVGTHSRFVRMIRELVEERLRGAPRLAVGALPPRPDVCPTECCPPRQPGR
jgi:protoporphyrin/coproporphyrin ferrochelatase